jgi:hypothetical protein
MRLPSCKIASEIVLLRDCPVVRLLVLRLRHRLQESSCKRAVVGVEVEIVQLWGCGRSYEMFCCDTALRLLRLNGRL